MKKAKNKDKNTPGEAILTPVSRYPKSKVTNPGVENVRRAKEYVDENEK